MSAQEALELIPLPDATSTNGRREKRFMSRQPAWVPGKELPMDSVGLGHIKMTRGAFGGVVYAMAPLAAARTVEEEETERGTDMGNKLGIHSIQGVFTNPGLGDRPFIFNVSEVSSSRAFSTRSVNVYQPAEPSSNPTGPFPISDASAPLGNNCFSCIVTFKRPSPSPADVQNLPPQERYADILSSRPPSEWPGCPQADIDIITALFPDAGQGAFPMLEMRKVDMTEYNADKPVPDRRELILYRPLKPIPREDLNMHIVCHAFEADRNGLIMQSNHLGYGYNLGVAATLSFSFYIHTNPEEAVIEDDGWWVQEVYWPRYVSGRGSMITLAWSPEGKHVATGYQDGIIFPMQTERPEMAKL
ncbi:thioesterase-like superfamily-domain-containing protein [Mariannaea sp. PMI_226]|nr:thioesterase-like superfamily-domain-containing protein [Mariannaea sp. PMI_226]